MATYSITDLLNRWARGEMTAERALGHLLQHLLELTQRVAALEDRVRQLEGTLPDPDA